MLKTLSETITGQALEHTEAHLQHFFYAAIDELKTVHNWSQKGQLSTGNPGELTKILMPIMQEHTQISAAVVTGPKGYRFVASRMPYTSTQTAYDDWSATNRSNQSIQAQ